MTIRGSKNRFKLIIWIISIILHLVVLLIVTSFWHRPIHVIDSKLIPQNLASNFEEIPLEHQSVPEKAEVPDLNKKPKDIKKQIERPPLKPKDTSLHQSLFDTSGHCKDCLTQPPFPNPEFYRHLGLDSTWAEILIRIDTSGQVVEVDDRSVIEEGVVSQESSNSGLTKLYDENIQRGQDFWVSTDTTAPKWNLYKASRAVEPKITKEELLKRYPPGEWLRQRVAFHLPKATTASKP